MTKCLWMVRTRLLPPLATRMRWRRASAGCYRMILCACDWAGAHARPCRSTPRSTWSTATPSVTTSASVSFARRTLRCPMARIAIIIPAYNAERYIAETIESVIAQTLSDWELVIVDDGSADDTNGVASRYAARDARIRALITPNRGVANARNFGFAKSSADAEFVMFLDSDDVLEPDSLD